MLFQRRHLRQRQRCGVGLVQGRHQILRQRAPAPRRARRGHDRREMQPAAMCQVALANCLAAQLFQPAPIEAQFQHFGVRAIDKGGLILGLGDQALADLGFEQSASAADGDAAANRGGHQQCIAQPCRHNVERAAERKVGHRHRAAARGADADRTARAGGPVERPERPLQAFDDGACGHHVGARHRRVAFGQPQVRRQRTLHRRSPYAACAKRSTGLMVTPLSLSAMAWLTSSNE